MELREKGLTYKQIADLGVASKGTISYHCSETSNKNTKERSKEYRLTGKQKILNKIWYFLDSSERLTLADFLDRFKDAECSLTGQRVNLLAPSTFNLDHRIPKARGGLGIVANMDITTPEANTAKGWLLYHELIYLARCMLHHNGLLRQMPKNTAVNDFIFYTPKATRGSKLMLQDALQDRIQAFNAILGNRNGPGRYAPPKFTYEELWNKVCNVTHCQFSGLQLDLNYPSTFCLDHILPVSRGGQMIWEMLQLLFQLLIISKVP